MTPIQLSLLDYPTLKLLSERLEDLGWVRTSELGFHDLIFPDEQKITFDLTRSASGTARESDLSALTLGALCGFTALIRAACHAKQQVIIKWPRPYRTRPSKMQKLLAGLQFRALFQGSASRDSRWWEGISHDEGRAVDAPLDSEEVLQETLFPMMWFDHLSYPSFSPELRYQSELVRDTSVADKIRLNLTYRGILPPQIIDSLVETVTDELAQNIVLHSQSEEDIEPFGIFAAHVLRPRAGKPNVFEFCVLDLGRGIPATVHVPFRESAAGGGVQSSPKKRHESVYWAVVMGGTSRKAFPTHYSSSAVRGFSAIRAELPKDSILRVTTGDVYLPLKKENDFEAPEFDRPTKVTFPGTAIFAYLPSAHHSESSERIQARWSAEIGDVLLATDSDSQHLAPGALQRHLRMRDIRRDTWVVIDFGFADDRHYIMKTLESLREVRQDLGFLLWNAQTIVEIHEGELAQFSPVAYQDNYSTVTAFTLTVARGQRDGAQKPKSLSFEPQFLQRLIRKANSNYLATAFHAARTPNGFFRGDIRVTRNSEPLTNFFALEANIRNESGPTARRWRSGISTALAETLRTGAKPEVILGIGKGLAQLLPDAAREAECEAEIAVIPSGDLPSRESWRSQFGIRRKFIVVVDVWSNGSLYEGLLDIIRRTQGAILGLVVVVDRRRPEVFSIETLAGTGYIGATWTLASFPEDAGEGGLSKERYWLDPVSYVPVEQDIGASDLPKDFTESLDLLQDSPSVGYGRSVFESRSTSVFVNTTEFLREHEDWVVEKLHRVLAEVREREGWRSYEPDTILHPEGTGWVRALVSRDAITQQSAPGRHAGREFANLAQRSVALGANVTSIPRAYDLSGAGRVGHESLWWTGEAGSDVLLVDDGYWSGGTARAICGKLARLGVHRILVVALIARVGVKEFQELQSSEVRMEGAVGVTLVRHKLITLLPVPYYRSGEDPYELTVTRLEPYINTQAPSGRAAIRALKTIGYGEARERKQDAGERKFWVRLRTLAQLALESEDAGQLLRDLIEAADTDELLWVLFRVFVEEWELVARRRLRKLVSRQLRRKAKQCLLGEYGVLSTETVEECMTTVRSHFRDEYSRLVEPALPRIVHDAILFDRFLLHVQTLDEETRKNSAVKELLSRAAMAVQDAFAETPEPDFHEQVRAQVQQLESLSIAARQEPVIVQQSVVADAVERLRRIYAETWVLRHQMSEFNEIGTGVVREREDLREVEEQVAVTWPETSKILREEIMPLIWRLKDVLAFRTDSLSPVRDPKVTYLTSSGETASDGAATDIHYLDAKFESDSTDVSKGSVLLGPYGESVIGAIRRLSDGLVGDTNTLLAFTELTTSVRVGDFAEMARSVFFRELDLLVPEGERGKWFRVEIRVPEDLRLMSTPGLLQRAIEIWAANIRKHVFGPMERVQDYGVSMLIESGRGRPNFGRLTISVKDEGPGLAVAIPVLKATMAEFESQLRKFGCDWMLPVDARTGNGVVQGLQVAVVW